MSGNPSEVSPSASNKLVAPLDLREGLVAVADYQRRIIAKARVTSQGLEYDETVVAAVPTDMTIYINPLKGTMHYNVVFLLEVSQMLPLSITASKLEEIADKLKADELVYHDELLSKTLDAIMRAFVESGRAKVVFRF